MFISADMEIEEIIVRYPQTIAPLQQMGVQCLACGEPVWGTLRNKIEEKRSPNIDAIIQRLNAVLEEIENKRMKEMV